MTLKGVVKNGRPRGLAEQARRFYDVFCGEDRVLVLIVADPDAMASAVAVKRLLWRRVASVTIARVNEVKRPDNMAMIRLLKIPLLHVSKVAKGDFTKVVMVDGQPHHHDKFAGWKVNLVIDHHPPGECLKDVGFVDVRPHYGATSTIMTEYLRGAGITISERLATALTYGIKTDTYSFGRQASTEDVKAFQLLFPKANQSVLRKIEFSELRTRDLALLQKAMERYKVRKHGLYTHLGKVATADTLVQIADFFMRVDSVDSTAVSGINDGKLIVVMRNVAPRSNAGKRAQQAFGAYGPAGGHKAMARAELPLKNLPENLVLDDDDAVQRWVTKRLQVAVAKPGPSGGE